MSSAARWSRKQTSNSKGSNKRSGTFSQHQPMINGEWHTHTLIMPPLIATSLSFLKFRAGSMICSWREGIAFIISQVSCALQAFSALLAKRSRTSSCKSHCFQKTHLRNTCYSCQYCWILKLANGTGSCLIRWLWTVTGTMTKLLTIEACRGSAKSLK